MEPAVLPGGWLEFLGQISLKNDSAAFNREEEMETVMKSDAVDRLTRAAMRRAAHDEAQAAQKVQTLVKQKSNLAIAGGAMSTAGGGDKDQVAASAPASKAAAAQAAAVEVAATKEVAAIPKATVEAKAVPDAEPKSNHSALPSKISQSVWDTSDNVTTKVTGAARFSPYSDFDHKLKVHATAIQPVVTLTLT